MTSLNTPVTRLLEIRTPIICAPMAGASGGALAAHVTAAGGFGLLAAGYDSIHKLKSEISIAKHILGKEEEGSTVPIGVGFLVWQLEKAEDGGFGIVRSALEENVRALWFSFGQDVGKYVRYVHDQFTGSAKSFKKPLIFVPVSTAQEAVIAVQEWKVDFVIAQGIESGGHGLSTAPPLQSLLASVLRVVPEDFPVIAAGGLATGTDVASVLAAGALGACLGTRFLLASESFYTSAQKEVLIKSSSSASVRTMAFDRARGTLGWPEDIDGRGIYNATVKDCENNVDINVIRAKFTEGVKQEDPNRMLVWSGTGVGQMTRIQSAEEIVHELHDECVRSLRKVSRFLE